LKSPRLKPDLYARKGDEYSFSSQAFIEILRAILDKGVPFRFRAKGFSMYPFIRDGDIITLSPLRDRFPRIGDVVAFSHLKMKKLVVHRIVGKSDDSLLMKGDNVSEVDGFIPKAKIFGYVTNVMRDGKPVFLGLGPERVLIALLFRWKHFPTLVILIRKFTRRIIRG
jgi:signal peptidase